MRSVSSIVLCSLVLFSAPAVAQVQMGSIVGIVTDSSNAVMPGVLVSLSGERLIGGPQTFTTDATGAYRFDRLPPGDYTVKFELQGFRTVERAAIRVNASFVATVNIKLEVGSVAETITVTGESPTIDTRSNLQQTIMNQEILEGVPTGRDPWSLAKLIPGVQVATYDVGGTQSIQQSALSAHGSNTNDVSYNIDGATVNWPGGGGGATMLYYDQGMFEEVNYMTSAIPAEVLAGGVSINMVTKDRRQPVARQRALLVRERRSAVRELISTCSRRSRPSSATRRKRRTTSISRAAARSSRIGCGSTARSGAGSSTSSSTPRNADGSQALDDNTLKNYSGKVVASLTPNQKLTFSYLWNDKIRGHRRDGNASAARHRVGRPDQPASNHAGRSTRASATRWSSSRTSASWTARRTTRISPAHLPTRIRMEDADAGISDFAARPRGPPAELSGSSSTTSPLIR